MPLTNDELKQFGEKLKTLLPPDGTPKGNKTLLEEFKQLAKKNSYMNSPMMNIGM